MLARSSTSPATTSAPSAFSALALSEVTSRVIARTANSLFSSGRPDSLGIEFGALSAAVPVLSSEDRGRCLGAAAEAAHKLLDDETWKAGYRLDPSPPPDGETLEGRVRAMAEAVEDAGALATA